MPIDLSPHFRVRFKRYNPIVITMLCLIAGIQSVSAQVSFVPELYDVVSAYKDTEPVKLPNRSMSFLTMNMPILRASCLCLLMS